MLDDDLKPVEPGSGVIGRLARGGNIPVGYHKDEAKTAATFLTAADGQRYAVPGDFATIEADGQITLLGRGSVCINSGGEKIFPEEVEASLKAHPEVFDVVVVGVPDERWGSTVAAVVQPRHLDAPPTLEELDAHCRSRIAGYKVPRQLHLVDQVLRSPAGKPDYRWALDQATGADRDLTHLRPLVTAPDQSPLRRSASLLRRGAGAAAGGRGGLPRTKRGGGEARAVTRWDRSARAQRARPARRSGASAASERRRNTVGT